MNLSRICCLLPACAALAIVPSAPGATDAAPATRVEVAARADNVSRDRQGDTTKRTLRLEITLQNPTRTDITGHKMVWKIVGRNVANRELTALGMGTEPVALKAGEEKVVHTSAVSISETDDRLVSSGKKGSGGNNNKNRPMKTIPASGEEYRGYFVEVYDSANRVVGSAFSPGMKEAAAELFKRSTPPKKKK